MNIPDWLNPKKWDDSTKDAAKNVAKAVALLVLAVFAEKTCTGKESQKAIEKLSR